MTICDLSDMDEEADRRIQLAMKLWLKWKASPEAQAAIPKELIVNIMCELAPSQASNIRNGTSRYKGKE